MRRPKLYHDTFWAELDKWPEVGQAFRDAGFDWERLPEEQRRVCIHAHNRADLTT